MDRAALTRWIELYVELWRTAGTDRLSELFTDDATYSAGPFEPTRRGLAAIAELWDGERESPDEAFRITTEIVAVDGDTGIARIEVWYDDPPPRHYKDLWIVHLDASGRCTHFEEWPTWPTMGTHPTDV